MRLLLVLLIVGLCLVTAKYIPDDSNDANSALFRVRRSDSHDSDSKTASAERDDSSNDNDHEDSEDNDSAEQKLKEEQNKIREKEEKKKQKLLEKLEKEKQKEIEEKAKLEEKLAKEQLKEQKRKEKEERKLQEKIEKERRKLEEENIKVQQKLEKEERKRQEKLKKQLEKLQKEQKESAEDIYLESEEEDSVEMEDIWKVHVYDKYGINITSTKLERQAALQRYLQEELGLNSNSTKSERRQAILKLIQTKLQNDSAAVDSFRNLLISHVNAAQIQKLKSKLENDLEELNNQSQLLNNITLPWVSVAQQNVEEKRSFLQAITQFLSNIVPNWFSTGQSSSNPNQLNDNGIPVNNAPPVNSDILNETSSTGQSSQSFVSNDVILNGSGNDPNSGDENNPSVLPSDVGKGSTSNNPAKPDDLLDNNLSNNNIPISQTNGVSSNSANSDLSNVNTSANPGLSSNNQPESASLGGHVVSSNPPDKSNSSKGSVPVNNILVSQNADALPPIIANSTNSNTLNIPVSTGTSSGNSLEPNGSLNIDNPVIETDINEVPSINVKVDPLNVLTPTNTIPGNALELNGSVDSGILNNNVPVSQDDLNGLPSITDNSVNVDLTNISVIADAERNSGSAVEPNGSVGSGTLNNNVPVGQINVNESPSVADNSVNVDLTNISVLADVEKIPSNALEPNESVGSVALNNNVPVSQTVLNGSPSVADISVNVDVTNVPALADSEKNASNALEANRSVSNSTLNNNVSVSQTDVNGLSSVGDTTSLNINLRDISGLPAAETNSDNGVEPSESVGSGTINNNISVSQTDINGLPSITEKSINIDSTNIPALVAANKNPGNVLEPNESVASGTLNNNIPVGQISLLDVPSVVSNLINTAVSSSSGLAPSSSLESNGSLDNIVSISQTDVSGLPSNTDSTINVNSPNSSAGTPSDLTPINPLEPGTPVNNNSLNNNALINQIDVNEQTSNTEQTANIDLSNKPTSADPELIPNNPPELNGSAVTDEVFNNEIVTQTSVNELLSNIVNTTNSDISSAPAINDLLQINKSVDGNSVSNILPVNPLIVSGTPSSTENSAIGSLSPESANSEVVPSISSEPTEISNSNTIDNKNVMNQSNFEILPSIDVSNVLGSSTEGSLTISGQSTSYSLQSDDPVSNNSVIAVSITENGITTDVTLANSNISDVTSSPLGNDSNVDNVTVGQNVVAEEKNNTATSNNLEVSNETGSLNIQNDVVPISNVLPIESGLSPATESLNASENNNLTSVNISSGDVSSVVPDVNISKDNNVTINSEPVANETLISGNSENLPTENIVSADNTSEGTSTNINDVQTNGVNSAPSDSTVSGTLIPETVTDIISTEAVYQSSILETGSEPNAESGNIVENVIAEGPVTDSVNSPVIEAKDVTQLETQTEQGNLAVQETVNTPSDLVTVAAVEAPSPPPGVIVPIEPAASIVDIKLQ